MLLFQPSTVWNAMGYYSLKKQNGPKLKKATKFVAFFSLILSDYAFAAFPVKISASTKIRPQCSQTITFLCVWISN